MQATLLVCARHLIEGATSTQHERQILDAVLGLLCEAAQAVQVTLFEHFTHPQDGFRTRPYASATAPSESACEPILAQQTRIPWSAVPEHIHMMHQHAHQRNISKSHLFFDLSTMKALADNAVSSNVSAAAVMLANTWWGYLEFTDRIGHSWDKREMQVIQLAADMIGAFLQRNRDMFALREREAMLNSLSNNIPEAYIYQIEEKPDGAFRRVYLSRGLEHHTGITVEQVLSDHKQLPLKIHPDDLATYDKQCQIARDQITRFEHEYRYIAVDGSTRWIRARSSPRRLENGNVLWDGIAFDTTAHRQLQEELQQANLGLRRRIDELSLLNRVTHLLTDFTTSSSALITVCRLLRDALPAIDVQIALYEEPTGALQIVAQAVLEKQPDSADHLLASSLLSELAKADTSQIPVFIREPGADQVLIAIPLRAQNEIIGLLQVELDRTQQPFTPDIVSLTQTLAGTITSAVANARLYKHAIDSSKQLERLNAASQMINCAGLDLKTLYAAIHQAIVHLMPVEAFVISVIEKDSQFVEHVYNYDRGGVYGVGRTSIKQSFAGFMRTFGSSLRVDDFATFSHPDITFEVFGDKEDTRSGVAASFHTTDGLYGVLFAQSYPPGIYTDDDVIILELLAAHAATAIDNARRAQDARRTAVDEERNRLARDLHDSVSQSLFSASLIAERLPTLLQNNPNEVFEGLELLNQLVRGALTEMRAMLIELRPAAIADVPLHTAIDNLARASSGRRGVPVTFVLEPTPELPMAVHLGFYRIAQECLTNVIKHARAHMIFVHLNTIPPALTEDVPWVGTVTLKIIDDGRGFDATQVEAGHLGIEIMRERASAIGAELLITSQLHQ